MNDTNAIARRTPASHSRVASAVYDTVGALSRGPAALVASFAGAPLDTCPLSGEIMRDPVVAADGRTYERSAIQAYFDAGHDQAPSMRACDQEDLGRWRRRHLVTDLSMQQRIQGDAATTADGVPTRLLDPVDGELMTDPITMSDGYTYDRETVLRLFDGGEGVSPFTGNNLDMAGYRNIALQQELRSLGLTVNDARPTVINARNPFGSSASDAGATSGQRSPAQPLLALAGVGTGAIAGAVVSAGAGMFFAPVLAGASMAGAFTGMMASERAQARRALYGRRPSRVEALTTAGAFAAAAGSAVTLVAAGPMGLVLGAGYGVATAAAGIAGGVLGATMGYGAGWLYGAGSHCLTAQSRQRSARAARTSGQAELETR